MHLRERFVVNGGDFRRGAQFDRRDSGAVAVARYNQLKFGRLRRFESGGNRRVRHKADVNFRVVTADFELANFLRFAVDFREKLGLPGDRAFFEVESNGARGKRLLRLDFNRRRFVRLQFEKAFFRLANERRGVIFRRRVRKNADVLVLVLFLASKLRFRQRLREFRRPLDDRFARRQVTHRLVVFDPRPARLAPTRRVENSHLDVEFGRGLKRRSHGVVPFRTERPHGAARHVVDANVADVRSVDPNRLHRGYVLDGAFGGEVAGKPVPVRAGADGPFRILEGFQEVGARRIRRKLVRFRRHDARKGQIIRSFLRPNAVRNISDESAGRRRAQYRRAEDRVPKNATSFLFQHINVLS